MGKASKYSVNNNPSISDLLFGSKDGKEQNVPIEAVINLLNSVAGKDYIQYKFSPADFISVGSFTSNGSKVNPTEITKLFLNKKSTSKEDLSVLFNKLDTLQNIVLSLRNPSDANNFVTFKITNITTHTDYFEFDVVLYKNFYSGNLLSTSSYSLYFDVKENFEDKTNTGGSTKTAQELDTDIQTRVEKVTGKSLVSNTEITKLSHLDDTTDLQKPVSTAQQAAIDAAVQAQLVDSTLINGVTTSSSVPPTGNIHAIGVGAGTYPNWGGMVIPANNIGTLQRVGGVYSVSLTAIILTDYAKKKALTETQNYTRSIKVNNNDVILDITNANFKTGYFLVPNGNEAANGDFSYTDTFNIVKENTSYNYKGWLGGYASIVFYDKKKEIISTLQKDPASTDFNFTTPANTLFARYTVLNAELPYFKITSLEDYELNNLDAVFDSVDTANEALFISNNVLTALGGENVNINDIILDNTTATFKTGYFLTPSGGEAAFAGYSYTIVPKKVKETTDYNYKGRLGGYASIVFRDKNLVFISSIQSESTDFNFTTPAQAYYAYFTCLDADLSSFKITSLEDYILIDNIESSTVISEIKYGKSDLGNTSTQDINTDYAHIVSYGQSLSTGTDNADAFTKTAISGNYMVGASIDDHVGTVKTALVNTDKEHFIVSTTNSFSKLYRRFVNKSQQFIASSCGLGGRTIGILSKAGQPYADGTYEANFITALTRAKAIADAEGKTISCPAILFLHGESDYDAIGSNPTSSDGNKATYKTRLLQLKNDMQADVISIYGQEARPMFYIYQVGGDFAKNKDLGIDMAQLEFAEENEDVILMNPNYFTPDYEGTHLSINGYRWYGEQCAKTMYKSLVKGERFQAVYPKKYEIIKNKINIYFHVPVSPLVFDSKIIANISGKGFYVVDDGVKQTISSVEIKDNVVTLTLPNELLGVIEVGYGSTYGDGGLGNLRDSDTFSSLYTYGNDTLDYSKSARDGYWEFNNFESGHPYYNPATTYAINDKVVLPRIDGDILFKSLVNGNTTFPCYKIAYRPLSQDGSSLIGKKYPMFNWCNHFYKSITI